MGSTKRGTFGALDLLDHVGIPRGVFEDPNLMPKSEKGLPSSEDSASSMSFTVQGPPQDMCLFSFDLPPTSIVPSAGRVEARGDDVERADDSESLFEVGDKSENRSKNRSEESEGRREEGPTRCQNVKQVDISDKNAEQETSRKFSVDIETQILLEAFGEEGPCQRRTKLGKKTLRMKNKATSVLLMTRGRDCQRGRGYYEKKIRLKERRDLRKS
jgi:hypothetical protein